MAAEIEAAILDHALEHPCHGSTRVEQELRLKGIAISSGGVRGVWQRHNLLTKHQRLLRLEKAKGERKIELKEDQIRLLERFSSEFRERHIEDPHTGALVAVDKRPHQGRGMNGRTPITVFKAGLPKPTPQKKEKTPPQKPDNQLAA